MKSHELFTAIDPATVNEILDWFRTNDRNVYKSAIATLAAKRKLRPVYVQKKSLVEQYAWIHKTLQIKACDAIGEQILQAFLMSGQQSMLGMFCDGMGIAHDGKGSVVGNLPKGLDKERLDATVDRLVDIFDPKIFTLYLHCFNMQVPGGYATLTEKIEADERLVLA
ncbi:MAG: hypothetical protein H7Y36_10135 [Armatimonadetes bacterium]|nr:hypothetical protein [Akkermansiaceae bacterium]